MKLVIEITDCPTKGWRIIPYVEAKFASEREDYVHECFNQAEQVARLTEVSMEISNAVNAYYSKDIDLMPKVVKRNEEYDEYGNPIFRGEE